MINLVNSRVFVISCEPLRRAEKRCRQLLDALRIRRSGVRLPPGTRFPNTGVSSARLYWENKLAFFAPKHVAIPVAVSVFPDEIYAAPRSWVERAYPKLIHYNMLDKGGHFAAWEQPQLFSEEVRAGFRPLRKLGRSGGAYDVRAAFRSLSWTRT